MRKPQSQPALASLTETDREQLADWLRRDSYDAVLARVTKPRPEGFGLSISIKPLQTFYAKVAILDLINSRLPDDKKITLATYLNLGSTSIHLEPATCKRAADAHEAILDTAHDLATSGDNTPTQLLALQRLADFPARAEIREQRLELDRQKAERQCEMHSWKRQMHTHKLEMDTFHKQTAIERLYLAQRNLVFRQKQHSDRLQHLAQRQAKSSHSPLAPLATNHSPKSDHLGPLATNWKEVGERVCKQFGISPEEAERRKELRRIWREKELLKTQPTPTHH